MHFTTIASLILGLGAIANAAMIPEGSPDGVYTSAVNSTGHEVLTYHGTLEEFTAKSAKRDAELNGREFLSTRAAANVANDLAKRDWATCGPYTGINYDPSAYGLASACGDSTQFWGNIAVMDGGAISYGCDYGNGNWCDYNTVVRLNGAMNQYCGPNANAWWNIPEYALSFGRTQAATCYCNC